MLGEVLVHFEHADLVFSTKDSPKLLIGQDLSLVLRVLKIVGLDVFPYFAHHLGAGQRGRANNGCQFF